MLTRSMTVDQAKEIARNVAEHSRTEMIAALDVLRREVERREALELEEQRLRAHVLYTERFGGRL